MTNEQSLPGTADGGERLIRERLRSFVVSTFYVPDAAGVSDDTSLVQAGIVDSTGVLEIIAFLASEFGLDVKTREVTPDNFDNIGVLARYVARKLAQAGAA